MKCEVRKRAVTVCFCLLAVCAFPTSGIAQDLSPNYLFLELVDYQKKPVTGAEVRPAESHRTEKRKTDKNGRLNAPVPVYFHRDYYLYTFSVEKAGYYPFYDFFGEFSLFSLNRSANNRDNPFEIELLNVPKTRGERKSIETEQRKREFFEAARKGEAASVRTFIKSGLNPNMTTSDLRGVPVSPNVPVMLLAAASGDSETVGEFLAAGVDVRPKNRIMSKVLINYLNARPLFGKYPQTDAEKQRYIEKTEKGAASLINAGADIHEPDENKVTPLMKAAAMGYMKTTGLLLEKGASVFSRDYWGRTPLVHAISAVNLFGAGNSEVRIEIAGMMLESKAEINTYIFQSGYGDDCKIPLWYAVHARDLKMIRFLLSKNADVNLACYRDTAVLAYAKLFSDDAVSREIIELLEANGAR